MTSHLAQKIGDMKRGDHACLIYDNHEDQMAAILPFIKDGLDRNESCLYIVNERSVEETRSAFAAYGINVDREVERGALVFSSNNMKGSGFHPQEMVSVLVGLVKDAEARGFSGFRATGEMTWVLGMNCSCNEIAEYEILLNRHFPTKLTGICQYNLKRFRPEIIRDILRTHPVVILKDKICRNVYCETEKALETGAFNDCGVNWMMENLIRFHTIEENLRHMIHVRDDFLSVASHELNTPLTALKLRTQMHTRKKNITWEEWKKLNDVNSRSVEHIIHIVGGMLDVTRMAKGALHLDLKDNVDLIEIIRACAAQMNDSVPVNIHKLQTMTGHWDPLRLRQLIFNLLSNAVKYGRNKPIEIVISGDGDVARFSVQDHGIGIAPEDQLRIFGLYERAVNFTNISGLGIGLYISEQIVKAHGGHIYIESEVGHGSTFFVELPRYPRNFKLLTNH